MRVFLSLKYHADLRNRPLITTLTAILAELQCETVCILRDVEEWGARHYPPAELMAHTFAAIRSCAVVLVDITEKGVGVGIEAGYAYAIGKPIVTIAHHTADISTTLQGISTAVLTYTDPAELKTRLGQIPLFQAQ